jgi:hypothetical protein
VLQHQTIGFSRGLLADGHRFPSSIELHHLDVRIAATGLNTARNR